MLFQKQEKELKINHIKQEVINRENLEKQDYMCYQTFVQTKEQQIQSFYQQNIKAEDCQRMQNYQSVPIKYIQSKMKQEQTSINQNYEQATSSLVKRKAKIEDSDESDRYMQSTIHTELSLSSRKEINSKEIDLSAAKIKKYLKIEETKQCSSSSQKQTSFAQYTNVQQQIINPIYSYKNYLSIFDCPQSDQLIQYYEARVRSLSEPLLKINTAINNVSIQSQQLSFSSNNDLTTKQICNLQLSLLQSVSFQVDKSQVHCKNIQNFMRSYPISQILAQKDKKAKKQAGKIIQQLEGVNLGRTKTNSDEQILEQYAQYCLHEQTMLNYLDIQNIIRNPEPSEYFSSLIEAQYYFFIIGDYKKLKRLRDDYQQDEYTLIQNNDSFVQIVNQVVDNAFADSYSSSNISTESFKNEQKPSKCDVDEFIAFKSQSTTSKLTKLQNSTFKNPFQDFSSHQQEKYNPNRNQFYNLPKYSMVFILELLSSKNLKRLGVSPEFQLLIHKIVQNVKKSGKIKEQKKKIMYNHNHYNCLFLRLNQQNTIQINNQPELKSLHQKIFGIENLLQPFDNLYVNIQKKIIERIIMIQLQLIQEFPLTQYIIQNKSLYQFEKSKINYIERVIQGISKLREGEIIKRF
ncbi:hypothetical protein ABPG74_013261 [Tetrahymena malaccensis]